MREKVSRNGEMGCKDNLQVGKCEVAGIAIILATRIKNYCECETVRLEEFFSKVKMGGNKESNSTQEGVGSD